MGRNCGEKWSRAQNDTIYLEYHFINIKMKSISLLSFLYSTGALSKRSGSSNVMKCILCEYATENFTERLSLFIDLKVRLIKMNYLKYAREVESAEEWLFLILCVFV